MKKLLLAAALLFPSQLVSQDTTSASGEGLFPQTIHFPSMEFVNELGRLTFVYAPKENTVCILGYPTDEGDLVVTGFSQALILEATDTSTAFQCPEEDVVAVAHSHTRESEECEHSDMDVMVLRPETPYLFSIVFCTGNRAEIHVYDSRHAEFPWSRE